MTYPPHLNVGDQVAIVSPSGGRLPAILSLPYELGLRRLRDEFELIPVEYPSTRQHDSTMPQRAADIHAAIADPDIKALVCSIGGDDQIALLLHLDAELIRANPKRFFGFSDATNMLAYLAQLGIVGYHGGAVMTAFGRPKNMHDLTRESLRAALFTSGEYQLASSANFTDMVSDWGDPSTFDTEPAMLPNQGWQWVNAEQTVSSNSWGGCLEIISWLAMANIAIPKPDELDGRVLFFETSEERPDSTQVYRILRNLGERGILSRCGALLMGRPMTAFSGVDHHGQRDEYVAAQQEAVSQAMREYAPDTMMVTNIDFGHTDPQVVIPYGGQVTVDGFNREITVTYLW